MAEQVYGLDSDGVSKIKDAISRVNNLDLTTDNTTRNGYSSNKEVMARLTDYDGEFASWVEVEIDSDGNITTKSGGMTGDKDGPNFAMERSHNTLYYANATDGDIYILRRTPLKDADGFCWLFNASLDNPVDPTQPYILVWNPSDNSYNWFDPPADPSQKYLLGWEPSINYFTWVAVEECDDEEE